MNKEEKHCYNCRTMRGDRDDTKYVGCPSNSQIKHFILRLLTKLSITQATRIKEVRTMNYNVQPVKWSDSDCKAEVLDSKGEVVRTIQYDLCSYRACKHLYFSAGGKFMGGDQ